MAQANREPSSMAVTWDFSIAEQAFVTRWGHNETGYFKQFLPGNIEHPAQYPPKRVNERQYNIARRIHTTQVNKRLSE